MTTAQIATSTWTIDPVHSIAEFTVKHMVVATVKGRFRSLAGTLIINEANPADSEVTATIDVASIDTAEPQRDAHLRSDDFFNAERFPHITFRSTRIEPAGEDRWRMTGDLTIRDVTRPVTLDVEYDGQTTNMYGKQVVAFTAQTELNRKEFGLKWNALLETGAAVVADRVRVTLHIEAIRNE